MQRISRKKLGFWGTVSSISAIPLAFVLFWASQTASGGDTSNVSSSNQSGGITAYQVNITPQPGQLNRPLVYPDKEILAIQLRSLNSTIQNMQVAFNRCSETGSAEQCQPTRQKIEIETALRNKLCKDSQVSPGDYGCP